MILIQWFFPRLTHPSVFSCSHPSLVHHHLVNFMELSRKPDKVSTFSDIARWRREVVLVRSELLCSILKSVNMSTQQQPPQKGLQCEKNTLWQHLLQIAPKNMWFWGWISRPLADTLVTVLHVLLSSFSPWSACSPSSGFCLCHGRYEMSLISRSPHLWKRDVVDNVFRWKTAFYICVYL